MTDPRANQVSRKVIKKISVRAMLLCVLPLMLLLAFCAELVREIGRAFRYAWLDARAEYESFAFIWRTYDGTQEGFEKIKRKVADRA